MTFPLEDCSEFGNFVITLMCVDLSCDNGSTPCINSSNISAVMSSSSDSNSESNSIDVLAFDEGLNRLLCLGLGVSIDIESLISILSGSVNTTFFPARILCKGLNL